MRQLTMGNELCWVRKAWEVHKFLNAISCASIHPYNVTERYFHIKQPRAVLLSKGSMANLSKATHDVPTADKVHGNISRCEAAGTAVLL